MTRRNYSDPESWVPMGWKRKGEYLISGDFFISKRLYRHFFVEKNLMKEFYLQGGEYRGEGFELRKEYYINYMDNLQTVEERWVYKPGKRECRVFPRVKGEISEEEACGGISLLIFNGSHHFSVGLTPPKPEDLTEDPPPEYLVLVEGREMLEMVMEKLNCYSRCLSCKNRFLGKML